MQGRYNEQGELVDPVGAPSEPPEVDGDAPMKPVEGTTLAPPPAAPAPKGAPSP
jgi:hypothetical protein